MHLLSRMIGIANISEAVCYESKINVMTFDKFEWPSKTDVEL